LIVRKHPEEIGEVGQREDQRSRQSDPQRQPEVQAAAS